MQDWRLQLHFLQVPSIASQQHVGVSGTRLQHNYRFADHQLPEHQLHGTPLLARCTMSQVTRSAGTNLILCSIALFLIPLAVFFAVYNGALDLILQRLIKGDVTSWARSVLGAILAVLTVNAVLVVFVLTAFNETPEEVAKKED